MVLAPVLSDFSFHTLIGEKKPPRSKLRGGSSFRHRLIRKIEDARTHSLDLHAKRAHSPQKTEPRLNEQPARFKPLRTPPDAFQIIW